MALVTVIAEEGSQISSFDLLFGEMKDANERFEPLHIDLRGRLASNSSLLLRLV